MQLGHLAHEGFVGAHELTHLALGLFLPGLELRDLFEQLALRLPQPRLLGLGVGPVALDVIQLVLEVVNHVQVAARLVLERLELRPQLRVVRLHVLQLSAQRLGVVIATATTTTITALLRLLLLQ